MGACWRNAPAPQCPRSLHTRHRTSVSGCTNQCHPPKPDASLATYQPLQTPHLLLCRDDTALMHTLNAAGKTRGARQRNDATTAQQRRTQPKQLPAFGKHGMLHRPPVADGSHPLKTARLASTSLLRSLLIKSPGGITVTRAWPTHTRQQLPADPAGLTRTPHNDCSHPWRYAHGH